MNECSLQEVKVLYCWLVKPKVRYNRVTKFARKEIITIYIKYNYFIHMQIVQFFFLQILKLKKMLQTEKVISS